MTRTAPRLIAVTALSLIMVCSATASAQPRAVQQAADDHDRQWHAGPSTEELAGLGCIVAGAATVVLVGAAGVASGAAAGGAAAANLAMPILGTAFAAGCGVGVMAAPGAAYLLNRYIFGDHTHSAPSEHAVHGQGPYESASDDRTRRAVE